MPLKQEKHRSGENAGNRRWKIFGGVFFCVLAVGITIRVLPPLEIVSLVRFYLGYDEPVFGESHRKTPKSQANPSAQTRFPIIFSNGKTIRVRLALTEIERTRGLMGCRELGENEGMLFVYSTSEKRAFWMKNVPIDLDIGYFNAAGKLLEVYTMRANNTRSAYSKSDDIRFCLEMNRGWFKTNGILPDSNISLDLESLRQAIRERGFPQ